MLVNVTAWLVVNSMRSERIQFNQLCIQNVSNVWRKKAFKTLLANHQRYLLLFPWHVSKLSYDTVPNTDSRYIKS